MNSFPINTPLGLGDLLDRVFRIYRLHASKMILAVAIFVVPMGVLSALLTQDATANAFVILRNVMETGEPPIQQGNPNLWAYLLSPLAFVVQGFVSLVSAQLTIDALHGRIITVASGLRRASSKFFPWLGMTILMGLAMGLLMIGVLIVFFILAFIFGAMIAGFAAVGASIPDGNPSIALMIGIGVIVFLLYIGIIAIFASPFLYLYGRWSVSLPVLLAEDQGPAGALGRSWNLTQSNARRAMGYVFLAYLLIFFVVGTPSSALQFIVGFALPLESNWLLISLISGIGVIANVLTSPILSIAYVLFYYELRVRKESYDLAVQLLPPVALDTSEGLA